MLKFFFVQKLEDLILVQHVILSFSLRIKFLFLRTIMLVEQVFQSLLGLQHVNPLGF